MATKRKTMKSTNDTKNEAAGIPEEVDEEGLADLLKSLPDDVMLTLCTRFGLTEEGARDD